MGETPIDPAAAPPFFLDKSGPAEDGIALCLSGGGYRAMLFHTGAIWRLNELGVLPDIKLISSVSGGSITAGALAVAWSNFRWNEKRVLNLGDTFLKPILQQSQAAIDYESIALGLLPWDSAFREVANSYKSNITGSMTLQDLPLKPEFTFNATNLMSGRDWRFSRNYSADWRVGTIASPPFPLAEVIAASSAFPPFLSPAYFDLKGLQVSAPTGKEDLNHPPFTEKAVLSDGGVYDNMGLEPAWKRYRTLLVSNAGRPFIDLGSPPTDWLNQMRRVVDITMDQDQALRERILVYAYQAKFRTGSLWGFNVKADGPNGRPPLLTADEFSQAKAIRTRLNVFTLQERALLLKAGYAHAEAGLRQWYAPAAGLSADPGTTPPSP
jgi:NTE family protein